MTEPDPTLRPDHRPEDEDRSLRPQELDEFIGQEAARANLRVFIESAKLRNEAMDHALFYGPPGLGKTTLAQIMARELGVNFRMTSGPVLAKAGDLAAILTNLDARDVLFIDEIHRLNPAVEEVLYPALEDFELDLVIGEGPAARTVRIDLQPFTLVGATTRLGRLTTPLRDRFGIPTRLEFYTVEELVRIVTGNARKMNADAEPEGAMEIARRARGTPRIAGRLLRRVVDFALVEGNGKVTREIADRALNRLGVDDLGLDGADRRYLILLAENYGGGPVGVETIAAALAESRDAIEEVIEPFLLQQGLIQRTPRGRMLAHKAWTHLGIAAPRQDRRDDLFDTDMSHSIQIRVYYEDTDLAGIVYYANYFKYIERGRTEFLRALGVDQMALKEGEGIVFAVRHVEADFLKPAKMDDLVEVVTSVRELGGVKIFMEQKVMRGDVLLFKADVTLVCLATSGRPTRIPSAISTLMGPKS